MELLKLQKKLGRKKFKAHKIILSAGSRYFFLRFKDMKIDSNDTLELKVLNDKETFLNVFEFLYTGDIILNENNIEKILATASFLQVEKIINKCEDYFLESLNIANSFKIMSLAKKFSLKSLYRLCDFYIKMNFEEFIQDISFFNLNKAEIESLISSRIDVTGKLVVIKAINNWSRKSEERLREVDRLNSLLRREIKNPRFQYKKSEVFFYFGGLNHNKKIKIFSEYTENLPGYIEFEMPYDSSLIKSGFKFYYIHNRRA